MTSKIATWLAPNLRRRSLENISSGMDVVRELQSRYVNEYMARMQWAGIDKKLENLAPGLAAYITEEKVEATAQESGAPA